MVLQSQFQFDLFMTISLSDICTNMKCLSLGASCLAQLVSRGVVGRPQHFMFNLLIRVRIITRDESSLPVLVRTKMIAFMMFALLYHDS